MENGECYLGTRETDTSWEMSEGEVPGEERKPADDERSDNDT